MSAPTTFGALAPGARFRLLPAGKVWRKVDGLGRDYAGPMPDPRMTGYSLADDRKVYPVSDAAERARERDGLVDVRVPVVLLFRAPATLHPGELAGFVERVFEHGTIRDVFEAAIDGAGRDPLTYDGYTIPETEETCP